VTEHRWPDDWDARRRGEGCGMCGGAGADEKPGGLRIFDGRWSDAYFGRWAIRPGYCYVVWKGRHVVEPTELSAEEAAGFWADVARVARAVERRYEPRKMNWLVLGNGVPHLHVHLVPRFVDDACAGGPIEAEAFERAREHPLDDETLQRGAAAIRAVLDEDSA
jgi:diadenosine tetraphosphate (Ap4A) HIT family hydrolase